MRAGLFGGDWEDYSDALQDAVGKAFWDAQPPPPDGVSAGAQISTAMNDPGSPAPAVGTVYRPIETADAGPGNPGATAANYVMPAPGQVLASGDAQDSRIVQQANASGDGEASGVGAARVGRYVLPGVGVTYMNPMFADKIGSLIIQAQAAGIPIRFTDGYRSREDQDAMQKNPNAITPAGLSLHSAGDAVDISVKDMDPTTRGKLVSIAQGLGIGWGGTFQKPDPVHFFMDPGGDRQQAIGSFSQSIQDYQKQIPDD